jgi:hypothetical protein
VSLKKARCYLKVLVEPLTSAEAQLRAQSELQAGETLVWSGVPDARRAAIAAISETITPGIAFLGIGFLLTIQGYSTAGSMPKNSHSLSPIFGMLVFMLPALIAGLLNLLRPLWVYRRGLTTVYAVTSHRVMIIRGSGRRSVRSLDPAEIVDVRCRERPNGSGEVMISTNFSVRTKNTLARRTWWFYGAPSAKNVAHLVSELTKRRSQLLLRAGRFVPLDFSAPK